MPRRRKIFVSTYYFCVLGTFDTNNLKFVSVTSAIYVQLCTIDETSWLNITFLGLLSVKNMAPKDDNLFVFASVYDLQIMSPHLCMNC